jgi:hypothetical protein
MWFHLYKILENSNYFDRKYQLLPWVEVWEQGKTEGEIRKGNKPLGLLKSSVSSIYSGFKGFYKTYQTVPFMYMQLIVCQLYLRKTEV